MTLIRGANFLSVSLFVMAVSYHQNSIAAAWTIIQEAALGTGGISQVQSSSSSNVVQAVNSINLSSVDLLSAGSSQSVNMNDKPVVFTQEDTSSSSIQALNRISADSISGSVSQSVTNLGVVNFSQPSTGSGNTQALNAISVTGNANNVIQSVTSGSTSSLTFNQSNGTGNLQAGNLVEANTVGTVSQIVSVDDINFLGVNPNLQAANVVIYNSGSIAGVVQTVTATTVNASGGLMADHIAPQALNYIGVRP